MQSAAAFALLAFQAAASPSQTNSVADFCHKNPESCGLNAGTTAEQPEEKRSQRSTTPSGTVTLGTAELPTGDSSPSTGSTLTASDIETVIRKHSGALTACYKRSLSRRPALQGKVIVEFKIDRAGKVASARIKTTTLRHSETEACTLTRFRNMKFPSSEAGAVVRYPLMFQLPNQ